MHRDGYRSSAPENLCRTDRLGRGASVLAGGLGALLLSAAPAAARDLNCFEWGAVTAHPIVHPHHHVVHHRRVTPVKAHVAARPHRPRPIATNYVKRPIACPSLE